MAGGCRVVCWFVYILRCSDNFLYIGETKDVATRLARHNEGRASSYTVSRRPVQLVFSEVTGRANMRCRESVS